MRKFLCDSEREDSHLPLRLGNVAERANVPKTAQWEDSHLPLLPCSLRREQLPDDIDEFGAVTFGIGAFRVGCKIDDPLQIGSTDSVLIA